MHPELFVCLLALLKFVKPSITLPFSRSWKLQYLRNLQELKRLQESDTQTSTNHHVQVKQYRQILSVDTDEILSNLTSLSLQ